MQQLHLVASDAEAARRPGDIQRRLRANGEPTGADNVLIRRIAVARDQPVLSRHYEEFSGHRPGSHRIDRWRDGPKDGLHVSWTTLTRAPNPRRNTPAIVAA